MIRGTTPTLTFNLPFQTGTIKNLYITFKDREKKLLLEKDITGCDLNEQSVSVKLTQEETLAFKGNTEVLIQLRVIHTDNEATASEIITVPVKDILKEGVI